ncbi:MAG TPA: hypothetical protein VGB96_09150, partial [Archangium sp.]
ARFDAQDPRASPLLPVGLPLPSAPAGAATTSAHGAAPAIAINTINVSGEDTGRALSQLERHLDNLAFRNRGTRAQPGRYAVEGG